MTPSEASLLRKMRLQITDLQKQLEEFQEGDVHILNASDKDITHVFVREIERQIANLEAAVEKEDPEGFTTLV